MFRGEGELLDPLLDRVRPAEETIWGWASCTAGKGSLRIARLCLDVEMPRRVGGWGRGELLEQLKMPTGNLGEGDEPCTTRGGHCGSGK